MARVSKSQILGVLSTIAAFKQLEGTANDEFKKATDNVEKLMMKTIRYHISLTDHSLADLRRLDHPYSKRNPRNIHRPKWRVHKQTGQLLDALESVELDHIGSFEHVREVGINEDIAPHAKDVIFGTSTMVGRDFVTGAFKMVLKDADAEFQEAYKSILKKATRY